MTQSDLSQPAATTAGSRDSTCPACGAAMTRGLQPWHFRCGRCRYEAATLEPTINVAAAHQHIDERSREKALRDLRVRNFDVLIERLRELKPGGGKLLEVGCAHGWFLEAARPHFDVLGIEPDEAIFTGTRDKGLPVRNGYFPDILGAGEKFDVIVFNDVLEHIPDINGALAACRERLNPDGVLVLNLPSSGGVFYRLSKLFCRLGARGSFDRMWQKGLPSPHLHYVDPANLALLLDKAGFVPRIQGRLATLRWNGLYTRLSYTGGHGPVVRALMCGCLAAALPLLHVLPSDIIYVIAARR